MWTLVLTYAWFRQMSFLESHYWHQIWITNKLSISFYHCRMIWHDWPISVNQFFPAVVCPRLKNTRKSEQVCSEAPWSSEPLLLCRLAGIQMTQRFQVQGPGKTVFGRWMPRLARHLKQNSHLAGADFCRCGLVLEPATVTECLSFPGRLLLPA